MNSAIYSAYGLDQTIHVGTDGSFTRDVAVPHEGANLQCNQFLHERTDPESGYVWSVRCKKRAGHPTPKDEQPHVPVDTRNVAAVTRHAHGHHFGLSGIPAGVDQSITLPHDCRNHLDD